MDKKLVDHPKPPFPLYKKKGEEFEIILTVPGSEIWICGECGIMHTRWNYGADKDDKADQLKRATECCLQKYCECGNKIEKGYTGPKCSGCNSFDRTEKILAKAVEIEDPWKNYDGPVYCEDNDKYWTDIDDFWSWATDLQEDGIEDDECGIPEWIFPCTVEGFARLDLSDLIQHALDEHHEDAHEHLVDFDAMQKHLNEWCDKQTLQSWHPDYSRKIRTSTVLAPVVKTEPKEGADDNA